MLKFIFIMNKMRLIFFLFDNKRIKKKIKKSHCFLSFFHKKQYAKKENSDCFFQSVCGGKFTDNLFRIGFGDWKRSHLFIVKIDEQAFLFLADHLDFLHVNYIWTMAAAKSLVIQFFFQILQIITEHIME